MAHRAEFHMALAELTYEETAQKAKEAGITIY